MPSRGGTAACQRTFFLCPQLSLAADYWIAWVTMARKTALRRAVPVQQKSVNRNSHGEQEGGALPCKKLQMCVKSIHEHFSYKPPHLTSHYEREGLVLHLQSDCHAFTYPLTLS